MRTEYLGYSARLFRPLVCLSMPGDVTLLMFVSVPTITGNVCRGRLTSARLHSDLYVLITHTFISQARTELCR
jgi:hypothetical protein